MSKTKQELESLKTAALDSIDEANMRALAYARELDVGEERTRWFNITENVRTSTFKFS